MHAMPAGLAWLAGAMLVLLASPLAAQTAPEAPRMVALTGRLEHPGTLGLETLKAFPPITVEITRTTPQGARTASYTGALLWTLVSGAGLVHEAGPHSHLRHTLMAQGRDGYVVALAVGEVDPDFEGKQVLVAYAQDGKPLPDLRLVVPGDGKAGRSVRDLVQLEVR